MNSKIKNLFKIAKKKSSKPLFRKEEDCFGSIEVPAKALWGAQTQRALKNFAIGCEKFPLEFFQVFGAQKWAAAKANMELEVLSPRYGHDIAQGCQMLWEGHFPKDILKNNEMSFCYEKSFYPHTNPAKNPTIKGFFKNFPKKKCHSKISLLPCDQDHQDFLFHFPISLWQTGSGTQTHMNVNEVIARIANLLRIQREFSSDSLDEKWVNTDLADPGKIHPNDHVNCSQSSNDTIPTVIHSTLAWITHEKLLPALHTMQNDLYEKSLKFSSITKVGRTHLQDAVLMTVGQEFSSFYQQITDALHSIEFHLKNLYQLAQGATAVGTGVNAPKDFSKVFLKYFKQKIPLPFTQAPNLFSALSSHEALVGFSGALNTLATALFKIAQDVRWLSSGPRCGLAEMILPSNEPGSSIMPGKVNPTQAEALSMVALQVMANHFCVSMAGSQGNLQLNTFKPLIFHNLYQSLQLLAQATESFYTYCLKDLQINQSKQQEYVSSSLALGPLLNHFLGYNQATSLMTFCQTHHLSLEAGLRAFQDQQKISTTRMEEILQVLNASKDNTN
jgi:fumarate hydratase, class II